MGNGYTRSPKLLKGALIQFSAPMLIPIPNIIIFQYNPETMTRTLTPWAPAQRQMTYDKDGKVTEDKLSGEQLNQLSQPFDPQETFSLTLELDATDALEEPGSHPVATIAGVADRISAMEMLCYPPGPGALGGLLNVSVSVSIGAGGISASAGAAADVVPRKDVPIVLFFWGPGRIVPVRIMSFSVEEQQYSPLLYPIRAKVSIGLKVLDENHLLNVEGSADASKAAIVEIAKACYKFTQAQKEALAMANLANSIESIIGMLPI
jgi:hypothetical protein